jgi:predicted RecB family nuclease
MVAAIFVLTLIVKDARFQHIDIQKMERSKKQLRTCSKGHKFYKSSDCPTCPICEQERKPKDNFLSLLVAPARRALENKGITTLQQLSNFSEDEILQLHGMGPSTIPKLKKALKENGLSFKHN